MKSRTAQRRCTKENVKRDQAFLLKIQGDDETGNGREKMPGKRVKETGGGKKKLSPVTSPKRTYTTIELPLEILTLPERFAHWLPLSTCNWPRFSPRFVRLPVADNFIFTPLTSLSQANRLNLCQPRLASLSDIIEHRNKCFKEEPSNS